MSTPRIEHRIFKTELRVAADGKPQIDGYAAVFNSETDLGYVRESIAPGAFTRAIKEKQDVRCLFNHDPNNVLGRTKSGTLILAEDNTGLKFHCDMPDTTIGKDVHAMIQRGDVDQCSFGFIVREEEVTYGEDAVVRVIKDCDLFDVSPVTYPAYPTTSVEARSNATILKTYKRDAEDGDPDDVDGGDGCGCDCPECVSGDCTGCTDEGCEDENCRCNMRSRRAAKLKTRLAEISLTM